jgi:hypothetical protein
MTFMKLEKIIISLSLLIFCSCRQDDPQLPGKILIERQDGVCQIYDGSVTPTTEFKLKQGPVINYSGLTWANQTETFFGTESIDDGGREDYRSNVVRFDLQGNIINKIFETKKGQIVGFTYPSRTDSLLLFTIETIRSLKSDPIEGLNRMRSILTLDLRANKVIDTLRNLGYSNTFQAYENPWLFDETGFIYVLFEDRERKNKREMAGVYRYNLLDRTSKLIIPNGKHAIASQKSNRIAYIRDKSIFVMDIDSGNEKKVYRTSYNEGIRHINWSPDDKYIYLAYSKNYFFDIFTTGEKLVNISTGDELALEHIGHGFQMYTWR